MQNFHLHLISDSTGETVSTVARAAVAQFDDFNPIEHSWSLVRTPKQIDRVINAVEDNPGVVMYTLVEPHLQKALHEACARMSVPCIPVLEQTLAAIGGYLGAQRDAQPGRQHAMNQEYFDRIEAMQYVLAHDDGQAVHEFDYADIVLVGVSRTSKTPTCMYLANRGIKAANIPYVPGVPIPDDVIRVTSPLVVGLTASSERLVQIRRNRLLAQKEDRDTDYVNLESVQDEVTNARKFFQSNGWPVIDVTRRSIEETAAAVLELYRRRVDGDR